MQERQQLIDMKNGGQIALYHLHTSHPMGLPLIITHGTVSTVAAVKDLGRYLAALGFDCWLLEWGGHGQSTPASTKQNFEYPAFNDLPTAIDTVFEATGHEQLFWVSHSGGGHLPLMYLARNPDHHKKFAGIVTSGAQATDAALTLKDKVTTILLWGVTNLFGYTPKAVIPVGQEGEPTRLLAQWARWNLQQKWLGEDGFNYMQELSNLTTPILMIVGGKDTIAPVSGCQKLYKAYGNGKADKSWVVCSMANGFSKDFTHGQMIRGRAARNEVFPLIGDWLKQKIYP